MNTTLTILDWFNNHKEDIWASLLTIYYGLEKAGGLRSIGARIMGPKQPISGPQPAHGQAEPPK